MRKKFRIAVIGFVFAGVAMGLILVCLAATGVWRPTVGVYDRECVPLGQLELRPDAIQTFELIGPPQGAMRHTGMDEFILKYPAHASDGSDGCEPTGECRIAIRDGDRVILTWQTSPSSGTLGYRTSDGAYVEECRGLVGFPVNSSDTEFGRPVPGRQYEVDFQWIDVPNDEAEIWLYWEYPTTVQVPLW